MTTPPETPPAWPLGVLTDAEADLWADVWSRPAASLWQAFGLVRDVATYCRTVLAFEAGGHTNAALGGLVQRMADQLGMTVAGAARNKWRLPVTRASAATPSRPATQKRPSARDRLTVVPPPTTEPA